MAVASHAGTHRAYPGKDGQAEWTWMAGSASRWFTCPKTVTHSGTNQARRSTTLLIHINILPLSQTARPDVVPETWKTEKRRVYQ